MQQTIGVAEIPAEVPLRLPDRPAPTNARSVLAVWASLLRRPWDYLVQRWNWKSALLSGAIRGAIFFTVNLAAGWRAAVGAMLAEFAYRTLLSGAFGSVTEALRKAEPAWAAALSASVILPLCSHAVEFTVHYLRGTPKLAASIVASVSFTVISTLFNLYAMRHGVLVVSEEARSLGHDLARMPGIIAGFLLVAPRAVVRMLRRLS